MKILLRIFLSLAVAGVLIVLTGFGLKIYHAQTALSRLNNAIKEYSYIPERSSKDSGCTKLGLIMNQISTSNNDRTIVDQANILLDNANLCDNPLQYVTTGEVLVLKAFAEHRLSDSNSVVDLNRGMIAFKQCVDAPEFYRTSEVAVCQEAFDVAAKSKLEWMIDSEIR